MKYIALCAFLLCIPALADCPDSAICPKDGDEMHSTFECKGFGETYSCKFSHTKTVYDADGTPRQVTHSMWVSCKD